MTRLLFSVVALAAGAGWGNPILHRLVRTSDGVRIALYRYTPAVQTGAPPVLLVPDLGMNRRVFDLDGHGLAGELAGVGRDVFVLEPRGHGASDARGDFALGAIVLQDLPAAAREILRLGPAQMDLVAFGYGGSLALASAAVELHGRVRRIVAIATPVAPQVPSRAAEQALVSGGAFRSLGATPAGAALLARLFGWHGRFERGVFGELLGSALEDLGPRASRGLLGWMSRGDLALPDGTTVLGRIRRLDAPTLLLLGLADNWAHPEFASPLGELAPRALVRTRLLTRGDLCAEDYSHLSLVQGLGEGADVFRTAKRFLSGESP